MTPPRSTRNSRSSRSDWASRTAAMPRTRTRIQLLIAGSLGLAALAWCLGLVGWGKQLPPVDAAQKPKPVLTKVYYGTTACIDCHSKGTSLKDPVCNCKEALI